MGCMLRIGGRRFDAKACAESTSLPVARVHVKGEPVLRTRPNGKKNSESSLNIRVSRAEFHRLDRQIKDARAFVKRHSREIRRIGRLRGVEHLVLDFGIARRDVAGQFDRFPAELLLACGKLGIGLEVSWYQAFDEA